MEFAWIDVGEGRSVYRRIDREERKRSELSAPMVISDHLHEIVGQHDGKVYTSKSALRRSYRAHGVEEVGTAPQRPIDASERRQRVDKADIGEALQRVKQGYKPMVHGKDPVLDD